MALKEFQDFCLNLITTIATDNTMVVAYLRRRGGGSKSGPLCAPLLRILTWCSRKKAQAQHIHASTMSCPGIHCVETECLVQVLFVHFFSNLQFNQKGSSLTDPWKFALTPGFQRRGSIDLQKKEAQETLST